MLSSIPRPSAPRPRKPSGDATPEGGATVTILRTGKGQINAVIMLGTEKGQFNAIIMQMYHSPLGRTSGPSDSEGAKPEGRRPPLDVRSALHAVSGESQVRILRVVGRCVSRVFTCAAHAEYSPSRELVGVI